MLNIRIYLQPEVSSVLSTESIGSIGGSSKSQ